METETNNLRLQYAQPESYEIMIKLRSSYLQETSPTGSIANDADEVDYGEF